MKNTEFSVLMAIYNKEKKDYLKASLESIFNQSLQASEIILVEDGKLNEELENLIVEYEKKYNCLKVFRFEQNMGLGIALNEGLNKCSYDIVFRMDVDDICVRDRFEKQMFYMLKHPEIDVLGTNIYEFCNNINEENIRIKKMPIGKEIETYILKRNPLNHMTVCFRKKAVMECGGYQPLLYLEDYYLWVRMFNNKKKLENLNEELVYARIGDGFEERRGNKKQVIGWKQLQKYMLSNNMISKRRYIINLTNMFLMTYSPNFVRVLAYKIILRK